MTASPAQRTTTRRNPAHSSGSAQRPGSARTVPAAAHPARRAAAQAIEKDSIRIELPDGLGSVQVPSPERLAFYGGIAALAALGIMEWPVALVIGLGHLLAEDHHHKLLADFGQALAEA